MNNVWLALPSVTDSFAWTLAWQSTLWLALGCSPGDSCAAPGAGAPGARAGGPGGPHFTGSHPDGATPGVGSAPSPSCGSRRQSRTPTQFAPGVRCGRWRSWRLGNGGSLRRPAVRPRRRTNRKAPKCHPPPRRCPPTASNRGRAVSARKPDDRACLPSGSPARSRCCCGLLASLRAGRRVVRQASAETDAGRLAALGDAARTLAIWSQPVLRVSTAVRCPMIWCWGRQPVLIVPRSTAGHDKLSWSAIFRHELAHWLRRDHWAALCADLVVIALWWQPLAWRVRRRLALLREHACDDWVLATGGAAADYAESLLSLVPERHPAIGLSVLGSSQSLKERLERLFTDVRVVPRVGTARVALAVAVVVAAIVGVSLAQQGSGADKAASSAERRLPLCRAQGRLENQAVSADFPVGSCSRTANPPPAQIYFTRSSAPPPGEPQATTGSQGEFELAVPADVEFRCAVAADRGRQAGVWPRLDRGGGTEENVRPDVDAGDRRSAH